MDRNQLLSAITIEGLIADGGTIVIYSGAVLKLDGWLGRHPGGKLAIQHMVGRDATDEINAYHHVKTLRSMQAFRIGKIDKPWINLVPPIRGGVFRKLLLDDKQPRCDDATAVEEADEWFRDAPSTSESSTHSSIATSTDLESEPLKQVVSYEGYTAPVDSRDVSVVGKAVPDPRLMKEGAAPPKKMSRAAFTALMEQQEIAADIQAYPSLDVQTQLAISKDYQALHERVKNEGYYDCPYIEYGKEMTRYSILFGLFLWCLQAKWYLTSSCFLGLFWHQIMFTAHDAGHRGITGKFVPDTLVGLFIADFCCGLSMGWWKASHNVHHLVTNMPEHDPDLQNVPLFATSPTFFKSIRSSFYDGFPFVWNFIADFTVRYQKWAYYPIMTLARFNLYFLSWTHLLSPRAQNLGSAMWTRPVEIGFMACYWYLFGYQLIARTLPDWPTRIAFVLISHGFSLVLHVQITLSHWATPTADLGPTESFAQRQLRTTMDVDCAPWLDFVHGGLQFQAVHHLFPRVPRHNLRKLSVLVREFCERTRIQYKCFAFVDGNKLVLSRLQEISRMVDGLVQCQTYMVETGESGLH